MEQFVQLFIQSFSLGSFYILLALGFALVFSVTHILNLAHGELIILAGYVAYVLEQKLSMGLWETLPIAIAISVVSLMVVVSFVLHQRRLSELHSLIITFGIALILQNCYLGAFSANYRIIFHKSRYFSLLGGHVFISSVQLYLITLSLGAIGGLYILFRKTFIGKALRATIQDRFAAQMAGIPIPRMQLLGMVLGGIAIGIAGPLYARVSYLHPAAGIEPTIEAIILTLFAGMGRIRILLAGGWLLGVAETTTAYFLGSQWREFVSAMVLVVILIFREARSRENSV